MYIAEKLLVQPDPGLYHFINQGVLDVDGMDDKEEMQTADVCVTVLCFGVTSSFISKNIYLFVPCLFHSFPFYTFIYL